MDLRNVLVVVQRLVLAGDAKQKKAMERRSINMAVKNLVGIGFLSLLLSGLIWLCFWHQGPNIGRVLMVQTELGPEQQSQSAYAIGLRHFEKGEFDLAIEALRTVLDVEPNQAEIQSKLGWAYHAVDKREQSVMAFGKAIRLDPNMAYAHNGLGMVQLKQQNFDEAHQAFEQAIKLEADLDVAYYGLGLAYMARGEFAQAVEQFHILSDLQPGLALAHALLAKAYYHLDQIDRVEWELHRASILQADDDLTSTAWHR